MWLQIKNMISIFSFVTNCQLINFQSKLFYLKAPYRSPLCSQTFILYYFVVWCNILHTCKAVSHFNYLHLKVFFNARSAIIILFFNNQGHCVSPIVLAVFINRCFSSSSYFLFGGRRVIMPVIPTDGTVLNREIQHHLMVVLTY